MKPINNEELTRVKAVSLAMKNVNRLICSLSYGLSFPVKPLVGILPSQLF